MIISGVQKLTLVDYPWQNRLHRLLAGCGLRCRYCHNPDFVLPERIKAMTDSFIPKEPFFRFLEARKGKLDGVSICGGEPTMHQDLPEFIGKSRISDFLLNSIRTGTTTRWSFGS
jgi:pyruvate formate lyase activating enzyme